MGDGGRPGCFFYGCAAIGLATVLLVGGCVLGMGGCAAYFYKTYTELRPTCDRYVGRIDAGDFAGAYAMLSNDAQHERGLDAFTRDTRETHARLGKLLRTTATKANLTDHDGERHADIDIDAVFEHGPCPLQFRLVHEQGTWKIRNVGYVNLPPRAEAPVP